MVCIKAKTRCDLLYPSCTRCSSKNLSCIYEQPHSSKAPAALLPIPTDQDAEVALNSSFVGDFTSDLPSHNTMLALSPSSLHNSFVLADEFTSSDSSQDGEDWNLRLSEIFPEYTERRLTQEGNRLIQPIQNFAHDDFGLSIDLWDYEQGFVDTGFTLNYITPKPPRAFLPRQVRDRSSLLNGNYVMCALRAYPFRIIPGQELPPFIHAYCSADTSRGFENSLPRPLAACAAIVQMFRVKNKSNAVFIWGVIRMEQERLAAEVRHSAGYIQVTVDVD